MVALADMRAQTDGGGGEEGADDFLPRDSDSAGGIGSGALHADEVRMEDDEFTAGAEERHVGKFVLVHDPRGDSYKDRVQAKVMSLGDFTPVLGTTRDQCSSGTSKASHGTEVPSRCSWRRRSCAACSSLTGLQFCLRDGRSRVCCWPRWRSRRGV